MLRHIGGRSSDVLAVALSLDGKTAVSASLDTTLRVWNVPTCRCVFTLTKHKSDVVAVALTPDGRTAISAGGGMPVRVWDISTGEQVALYPFSAHAVAITAALDRILAGTSSGQLHFFAAVNI